MTHQKFSSNRNDPQSKKNQIKDKGPQERPSPGTGRIVKCSQSHHPVTVETFFNAGITHRPM